VIIQNEPVSHSEGADLSFTLERDDLATAKDTIAGLDEKIGIETDDQIGKVSIVGAGMRSHPGVAAKVFGTLGEQRVNIERISTSPLKISCAVADGQDAHWGKGASRGVGAGSGRGPARGAGRRGASPHGDVVSASLYKGGG